MQHFLTWPTASTAVCGSDMVGQRNSRTDLDASQTTCRRCLEWIDANPDYFEN